MIEYKVISSLEKVFTDERPGAKEHHSFSVFQNERHSFQIAFCSDEDSQVTLSADGAYTGNISVYTVNDVPVVLPCYSNADDYYLRKEPGDYPDLLRKGTSVQASAGRWYSFWVEFDPSGISAGKHEISFTLESEKISVSVTVIGEQLPERGLVYTNWFHCDGICDYYGVEPFSDRFWEIFRSFAGTAAKHGMNCILTPLFTPALDTFVGGERTTVQLVGVRRRGGRYYFDFRKLAKWVEICSGVGIEYFEMSHFFTQWGARHAPKVVAVDSKNREKKIFGWKTRTSSREYDGFLTQLSTGLKEFIEEKGLSDRVFFHISDEPSPDNLKVYGKRASLMEKLFGDYPVIDALSDYQFYKLGTVDIPVPSVGHIDDFYGKADPLWTYYCCGQGHDYLPNRFIAMPSLRNRLIGTLAYRYNLSGFLQWGYNFYNSHLSLTHIDPYKVTDANGVFAAGDPFIVYPGENGEAECSLRIKVLYEGFCDLAALRGLEKKIGREKVLEMIGDISMTEYPRDSEWLIELRENINRQFMHFE